MREGTSQRDVPTSPFDSLYRYLPKSSRAATIFGSAVVRSTSHSARYRDALKCFLRTPSSPPAAARLLDRAALLWSRLGRGVCDI